MFEKRVGHGGWTANSLGSMLKYGLSSTRWALKDVQEFASQNIHSSFLAFSYAWST